MARQRALALGALLFAVAALAGVAATVPEAERFDPDMNRVLDLQDARKLARGAPRAEVERRFGPGGVPTSDLRFEELPGGECRYYLAARGSGHVQLCYLDGRLAGVRAVHAPERGSD